MRTLLFALFTLCLCVASFAADPQGLRIGAPIPVAISGGVSFNTSVIDATTKKVGYIFEAREAAVMTAFQFRYAAHAATPVQHRISLQTVSTSTGFPTGSISACAAFTPPADNTWDITVQTVNISNDCSGGAGVSISTFTMTKGTVYAIVIEPCPDSNGPCSGAATPSGTNSSTFTTSISSVMGFARESFPYAATYSSTWNKIAQTEHPVFGYTSASKTYGNPVLTVTANTCAVAAECGMSFNIPSTLWATYKVSGVRFVMATPSTGKTIHVNLYSGTTVLQTISLPSDQERNFSQGNFVTTLYFSDASLTALSAGTTYRIGLEIQDAVNANALQLYTLDFANANDRTAYPGGTMFAYASRSSCAGSAACDTTSTAWAADTTTSRPIMELILDDITPPAAGGGASGFVQ